MLTLTDPHRALLGAVRASGPLSRTELAIATGYSRAAVTTMTREMLENGILREGETVYGQGRPSVRLDLDADGACFVGLALFEDPIPAVLIDLQGAVRARASIPWTNDTEQLADSIAGMLPQLVADAGVPEDRVIGIGAAVPGFVDECQEVCLQSSFMGWRDINVARPIAERTGLATFIENDANAVAIGERLFGAAREQDDFALVSLGAGIGCALVVGGHLRRGHSGGAGEISHATYVLDGPPCRCGKRGCLTTISSGRAVLNAARERGLDCSTAEEVEALAERGDHAAVEIIHRAGSILGLAISNLIQTTDPAVVIVILHFSALDGLMHRVTQHAVETNLMPRVAPHAKLIFEKVSPEIWCRGAASVATGRVMFPRDQRSGQPRATVDA
ncbi:ROK family transcriptional regulator [Pelagovum pacificum]|nr:ROK family transcriptional regulator [Pelagovum pacificum]QQA44252.1 ROK family transcriptional regulator [Pelagovum pacificum]